MPQIMKVFGNMVLSAAILALLLLACAEGHVSVVNLLVEQSDRMIDITAKDWHGMNGFMYACYGKSLLYFLLEKRAIFTMNLKILLLIRYLLT